MTMANFVQKETTQTMTWLEFYGLCREAGLNAFRTQEFMDSGGDAVNARLNEMDAAAGADDAKNVRIAEAAGEGIMVAGAALAVIPVVGEILAIVVAACGAIIKFFAKYFVIECDKYHCGGFDRKTKLQRDEYKEHQQTLVGVHLPSTWDSYKFQAKSDCSCDYEYNHCSFIRYVHDGLVVEGIEYATLGEGSKTRVGRVRGANGLASGRNKGCVEHWRTKAEAMPLDSNGKPIAKGEQSDPAKAYLSSQNTYYRRGWVVRQVLWWMQENILCRTMNCMEQVLLNTSRTDDDSEFNQKRRRGSRWYASIVWMMRDVWQYAQQVGWDKVKQILTEVGVSADAMAAFNKMKGGGGFPVEELPFEWWPLTSKLTFNQLRAILVKLKPLFPYERPAQGHLPEGAAARRQSIELKPLMLPIRTGIMFGKDMRPIPAKIGSRGPGAGTVVLGTGAALVAGYAIYRLVSRR
jgi:hypothetical protein